MRVARRDAGSFRPLHPELLRGRGRIGRRPRRLDLPQLHLRQPEPDEQGHRGDGEADPEDLRQPRLERGMAHIFWTICAIAFGAVVVSLSFPRLAFGAPPAAENESTAGSAPPLKSRAGA